TKPRTRCSAPRWRSRRSGRRWPLSVRSWSASDARPSSSGASPTPTCVASSTSATSRPGDLVGTPAYVAPEQVEGGDVTTSADIYAFGVVLYEMMTGRLPFEGDAPISTVLKRFREAPVSPRHHTPGLAPRWEAVILRCLEREPCNRFTAADHVVKALGAERCRRRARRAGAAASRSRRWWRWRWRAGGPGSNAGEEPWHRRR